ncbi:MAG: hypothetical protein WCY54_10375, partial [Syntrophales bacterium]
EQGAPAAEGFAVLEPAVPEAEGFAVLEQAVPEAVGSAVLEPAVPEANNVSKAETIERYCHLFRRRKDALSKSECSGLDICKEQICEYF